MSEAIMPGKKYVKACSFRQVGHPPMWKNQVVKQWRNTSTFVRREAGIMAEKNIVPRSEGAYTDTRSRLRKCCNFDSTSEDGTQKLCGCRKIL